MAHDPIYPSEQESLEDIANALEATNDLLKRIAEALEELVSRR